MRHVRIIAGIVTVVVAVPAVFGAAVVETLDGRSLSGDVQSITDERLVVSGDDGESSLPLKDVAGIVFAGEKRPVDATRKAGQLAVRTPAGGWIACESLALTDGRLDLTGPLIGEQQMGLKAARTLLLPEPGQTPQQVLDKCERYRIQPGSRDVLAVARDDGKWVPADGVLLSITDEMIGFRYRGQDRTIARDTVRAIWLAELSGDRPKPAGVLVGRDGCRLQFSRLSMNAETVTAQTLAAGELKLPRAKVASIRYISDRLVNLGDIEPASVEQHGTFDHTFEYRRNRAAHGGSIRLDGREYRHGLGLHSFAELTYMLEGTYTSLLATVGIDDAVRPSGQATLEILGDGKPLAIHVGDEQQKSLDLTGKDNARTIRVDVRGVKSLTLRVDFGADGLGVGDHVNLAAARLVK
jgi:hypothetical protein